MQIRDAVEADATEMVEMADAPADVMRNLIHDRTVRVAVPEQPQGVDPNEDTTGTASELLGFVSFDAQEGTVHITQLNGTNAACEQLLEEPLRFAEQEEMAVEFLIPGSDEQLITIAEQAGFKRVEQGPVFKGTRTVRYRFQQ